MDKKDVFICRVAKMRQLQKDFFFTHNRVTLKDSMKLEAIVDKMLIDFAPILDAEPTQLNLDFQD